MGVVFTNPGSRMGPVKPGDHLSRVARRGSPTHQSAGEWEATMRALSVVLALMLVAGPVPLGKAATADEMQWICIADSATGFSYQGGKWVPTNFSVEGKRYLISKKQYRQNKNDMRYHVTKIGERHAYACQKDSPNEFGMVFCQDLLTEFKINVTALRYMSIYSVGYFDGSDDDSNTPYIEIGTCSPL